MSAQLRIFYIVIVQIAAATATHWNHSNKRVFAALRRICFVWLFTLGVAAGGAFSALIYFGLLSIPPRYLFSVTSARIALLAAGLAAQAVQFLASAGLVTSLQATVLSEEER